MMTRTLKMMTMPRMMSDQTLIPAAESPDHEDFHQIVEGQIPIHFV